MQRMICVAKSFRLPKTAIEEQIITKKYDMLKDHSVDRKAF